MTLTSLCLNMSNLQNCGANERTREWPGSLLRGVTSWCARSLDTRRTRSQPGDDATGRRAPPRQGRPAWEARLGVPLSLLCLRNLPQKHSMPYCQEPSFPKLLSRRLPSSPLPFPLHDPSLCVHSALARWWIWINLKNHKGIRTTVLLVLPISGVLAV